MPIEDIYNEWFRKNEGRVAEAPSTSVICDGYKFFFKTCIEDTESGYKGVLGYSIVNNHLACRMWYYSGSEASWRAFTGLRNGAAWMKGYEGDPDPLTRSFTSMGYIFECLVTVSMGMAIEAFWAKTEKAEKVIRDINCCPPDFEMNPALSDFMKGSKAKISKDYGDERTFKNIIIPLHDVNFQKTLSKASSVKIQNKFIIGDQHNIGAKIRTNTDLDAWLTECIKNEKRVRTNNYHPTLDQYYNIFEYSLADNAGEALTIEIAATQNSVSHRYSTYDGTQHNLETKICWVRDVYYNKTAMTSYGTRKLIPINLSFLVQKPIDYFSQVSEDYVLGLTPDGQYRSVVKLQLEKKKEKKGNNLDELFAGKGGYNNKYIILSYLNESTSTLIYEFKRNKQYPQFDTAYNKPIGPSQNTGFDHTEDAFVIMQQTLMTGINEYNCLRLDSGSYNTKGMHGDEGLKRANALRQAILECNNQEGINKVLYDCFIDNKIRVGNAIVFEGSFFSKIRTNQTSLFTCICRALLSSSVLKGQDGKFHLQAPLSTSSLKGRDQGIARMKTLICNKSVSRDNAQSAALFITGKAAELLVALKG